ncbi:uncharacterized protein [Temnothorax nylanderi]|uniref:uncharacterized protein n=1 Tax=Temnothorax nylanderi TaxID=102681 RepID=UPI003A894B43
MDQSALLNGQHDIHRRIAHAMTNLRKQGADNITLDAVRTRIRILDDLWAKFESNHDLIRVCYRDLYTESEYYKTDFFDTVENAYVHQHSLLTTCANTLKAASPKVPAGPEQSSEHAPKTSLPRIQLPHFSGTYEEWPPFRDLFLSVIGENSSISNIERFHYLRSCLQGPAEKLIHSLTVTGNNYDRAWAILSTHYENKKKLIRSNFATFTAVAKMKTAIADGLSRVHNAITSAVNAQESIGRPIDSHGMNLFNHLVVELFDPRTRLEWESSSGGSVEPPNHDTLMNFITKRILTLNAAYPKNIVNTASEPSRSAKTHIAKRTEPSQCPLCNGEHSLMGCRDFKAKQASERKTVAETNKLCFNCLGNHPVAKCQSTRNCMTCNSRHHTMLHDAYASEPKPAAEVSALSAVGKADDRKAILLATARVIVADRRGEPHEVRALIDRGSEVSIVSESLVQRLRLPRSRTRMSIFGIGGSQSGSTRGKVSMSLTSTTTGATLTAVAFVLPRLSLYQGSAIKCNTTWPHLQGLPLADPRFAANDPVELLLGAEVCSAILEDGLRRGKPQTPIAQKTTMGWILSRGCGATSFLGHRSSLHAHFSVVKLTPEEGECERHSVRTHKRTPADRHVARLPFSSPPQNLAEIRKPAEDEKARHPRDRYVDDVVTGEDTVDDAIAVQTEHGTAGGCPLHKGAANSEDLPVRIPQEHRLQRALYVWKNDGHFTLDLREYPARLLDPLGWLAPIAIEAKIHGLANAFERGYAAAVYLRVSRNGSTLHLLMAKSKAAPIQQVSLARLKLFTTTLLTKLPRLARGTLSLSTAPTFFWSDARVVTLHWVKGHASRWKTSFVPNRVSLVQRTRHEAQFPDEPTRPTALPRGSLPAS